jgi:hypothetical protein
MMMQINDNTLPTLPKILSTLTHEAHRPKRTISGSEGRSLQLVSMTLTVESGRGVEAIEVKTSHIGQVRSKQSA